MKFEVVPLVLLLAAGVGRLGVLSRAGPTRSKKVGAAAVACAVAGFIPALIGPTFNQLNQLQILTSFGVVTLLLGVAAVVLAIWALFARRHDHGVSYYYPVIGLLFGIANLVIGAGLFALGTKALVPTGGTPWTWQSAEYGFEVTIPSERWIVKPNPNVLAAFQCSRPSITALVAEVLPCATDSEYEEALANGKKMARGTPTVNTIERSGPNQYGHPHWTYMGDAKSGEKAYFFGVSITRVGDKAVLLLVEGHYRMESEAGRLQELQTIPTQADYFLGSVR